MERYIGIDAHSTSCTIAIVGPSGRHLGSQVVETSGRALVEAIRKIPRPRHLCMEEGTQSAWLHELLAPEVEELVVASVMVSRGPKSDVHDAFGLAEALRLAAISTPVFKAPTRFALLRELVRAHSMVTRDVVRTQNRIKSTYRARGVPTTGNSVYRADQRDEWLARLPATSRASAELLYSALDALREVKHTAQRQLSASESTIGSKTRRPEHRACSPSTTCREHAAWSSTREPQQNQALMRRSPAAIATRLE
ncbi:MAG: transposase [Polyangiaceae bacterium]|nr:transposase [Polyangiaceae bacterium]